MDRATWTRREFLAVAGAGATGLFLAACGSPDTTASATTSSSASSPLSGSGTAAFNPSSWPKPVVNATPFTTDDVQLGDPSVDYFYLDTNSSYPYLIWTEGSADGSVRGVEWHCALDPATGNLDPSDGKGFRAFDTTALNDAAVGTDRTGLYYAGADPAGNIYFVRPTGATTGTVTKLLTPPDPTRRGYYPSLLGDTSSKDYLLWVKNSTVAGTGSDPRNAWVELQYIDVADPTNVHTIERQNRPAGRGFAPLDIAFFRWVQGEPAITYGSARPNGGIDIKWYNVETGQNGFVTDDGMPKVDQFGFVFGHTEYMIPGIDYGPVNGVYTRPVGSNGLFTLGEKIITPSQSALKEPFLAQNDKPIVWHGKLYDVYSVADMSGGANWWQSMGSDAGEIWLSTVGQTPQQQWLISGPETMVRTLPKQFVGTNAAYVYYQAAPLGSDLLHATWQLRRATTPLATNFARSRRGRVHRGRALMRHEELE